MTDFLNLLEAYHHWCVNGGRTRLESCRAWLAHLTPVPTDDVGWHRLGTDAMEWLSPLSVGWESNWRVLSPREMTLTVEALEYLEARRPGAIAAALPQVDTAPKSSPPLLADVHQNWGLTDVLACVEREVARRQADYPRRVQQGRLSVDQARQELGQMQAAASILRSMQAKGQDARQQTLFE